MKKEREFDLEFVLEFVMEFYVVVVAVVVVIVDVDDEEGEGGGEDAQRRKSNNPSLKGFPVMHESLPYPYCTHAMLCTMHVFSAFIWPFHCIHIAVTKAHAACRRPKSFVRRCTSETILTSADAACRRPVSFLRMMHHCIMAPGFQPKERPAN